MVLFWKTWCALCGGVPSSGASSSSAHYPDLRNNTDLFEIARIFKVTQKRKCPTCTECKAELDKMMQFSVKVCKTQTMLNEIVKLKLHENEDMLAFRKRFLASGIGNIPKRQKKKIPTKIEEESDPEGDNFMEYVEVVATKEEDLVGEEDNVMNTEERDSLEGQGKNSLREIDSKEEGDDGVLIPILEMTEEEDPGQLPGEDPEQLPDDDLKQEMEDEEYNEMDEVEEDNDVEDDEEFTFPPRKPRKPRKTAEDGKTIRFRRQVGSKRQFKYSLKCDKCDLVLRSEYHFQLHSKKHEPKEPPSFRFVCDTCGKKFKHISSLRLHSTVHSDEKPCACDKCGMRFKNIYMLKCHLETHSETKFICPKCGMQLSTNHTYHAHMKIHSDARPYKCSVCPKVFKRHQPLKEHLFGHTDLRPYSCPFCDKTFVNGSSCRLHKVRLHPVELKALEDSGKSAEVMEQHRKLPSLKEIQARIAVLFGLDQKTVEGTSSN